MLAALETSTRACSVALYDMERKVLVEESFLPEEAEGAAQLHPALALLLERQGLRAADLTALAVAVGPGSFTGIRVGLATAQGLVLPGSIPVFGVPTLDALAETLRLEGWTGEALCLMDAMRGECFTGHYRLSPDSVDRLGEPRILRPDAFPAVAEGPVLVAGPGALRYEKEVREVLGARALFPLSSHHRPRASSVASLASARWSTGERPALDALKPLYLRAPTPEEVMKNKMRS